MCMFAVVCGVRACVRVSVRVSVRVRVCACAFACACACACVGAYVRASELACARVGVSFYSIIFGILPGRVYRYSVVSFMHYAHSICLLLRLCVCAFVCVVRMKYVRIITLQSYKWLHVCLLKSQNYRMNTYHRILMVSLFLQIIV